MCLYCKYNIFKTAVRDIPIYKILQRTKEGWVTPIQKVPVNIGEHFTPKEPLALLGGWNTLSVRIEQGAIHCYDDVNPALSQLVVFTYSYPDEIFVIFKGIIPRECPYIKGVDSEIAASLIICQEPLYIGHGNEVTEVDSLIALMERFNENQ